MEAVEAHFLEPLARVFSRPKNLAELARIVGSHCPVHATEEALEGAVKRIVERRKSRTFPSAAELIDAVKAIPPPSARARAEEAADAFDKRERRAFDLLRGSPVAERAIAGHWAPSLTSFVMDAGRLPNSREEPALVERSKANDEGAAAGALRSSVLSLRMAMHEYHERQLVQRRRDEEAV